ncbi:helix-turn-helix domain-containing protein [Xylocopilactobacillus apicola]|uniref:HTH cro/C1-type domain-containing protein n=1 Tax=Xylocopilactobacillus apicola TaxID=2932184 RepID=A0AAU9CZV5_9LACO|nr:helix-turn-helix transcriptional regulator [Xylocopilactobacillus apicola]BDR59557.1 hypothetical protein XA3_19980 [Xylocopilactobacillus apicola]
MFGSNLKRLRLQYYLSMAELSEKLNRKYNTKISTSMISRWENNQTEPRMSYIRIIADFFNVTPGELLDNDFKIKQDKDLNKYADFSNQLQTLMKTNGDSVVSLSEKIGVPYSTVSSWVNGKKMPRNSGIKLLEEHYETHLRHPIIVDFPTYNQKSHNYVHLDFGFPALDYLIDTIPYDYELKKITIPDILLGKYAGDPNIFIGALDDDSMNKVFPKYSSLAYKSFNSVNNLSNNEIVILQEKSDSKESKSISEKIYGKSFVVRRFCNNTQKEEFNFIPESKNPSFREFSYSWKDADKIKVVGKVVAYFVNL